HLGRPFQGTPREHAVVLGWAKLPNTVMKLSALPEAERYPHRKVEPVVKALVAAWGAERLIYGGGWGAGGTAKSYRAARERVSGMLGGFTVTERAAVLGGNAARLFGWAPG